MSPRSFRFQYDSSTFHIFITLYCSGVPFATSTFFLPRSRLTYFLDDLYFWSISGNSELLTCYPLCFHK